MYWKDYKGKMREEKFNQWLVEEYFKYRSVEEVYIKNRYDLPISYAQYQRVLDKWGIVKTAGPNNKLSEAIDFLYHFTESNIPLEKLYKKMPPSFQTSLVSIYRILGYIKEGITRRLGTGLIITAESDGNKVLLGNDVSTPRIELGKPFSSLSIPMGFARKRDMREVNILRILQQEVYTDLAITRSLPDIIPTHPKPFMFLDIADIRVEIFHIPLPEYVLKKFKFTSYKLKDHRFVAIDKIEDFHTTMRVGVKEAFRGYAKYLDLKKRNLEFNPLQYKSEINYFLAEAKFSDKF